MVWSGAGGDNGSDLTGGRGGRGGGDVIVEPEPLGPLGALNNWCRVAEDAFVNEERAGR